MNIHTLSTILALPTLAAGAFAAFSALASYLPGSQIEATEAVEAFADEADIFAIDEDLEAAEFAAWSQGLSELVALEASQAAQLAAWGDMMAELATVDANAELATIHVASVRALRKSSVRIDRAARVEQFARITRYAIAANVAYRDAA